MSGPRASGRCLCGAVRFVVQGPLRPVVICHCRECRRWAGHTWAATAALAEDLVVEGDGLAWIESPESDSRARRGFCRACGSSLFWQAAGADRISIAAGALDEPTGLRVVAHVYTSHVPDYYTLPDDGSERFPTLSGSP
jgi:hypothetical protein